MLPALGPVGMPPGVVPGLALGPLGAFAGVAGGAEALGAEGVAGAWPQPSLNGRRSEKDGRPPRPWPVPKPPRDGPDGGMLFLGPVGRAGAEGAVGKDGTVDADGPEGALGGAADDEDGAAGGAG